MHIVKTSLALLHYTSLPLTYWSHAFQTTLYLINRHPTPILNNKSPYECLFQQSPNYSKLKPFDCVCYPWLRPYTTSKFQPKSQPCLLFVYSSAKSAYKCYDLEIKKKLYNSYYVEFIPDQFPSHKISSATPLPTLDIFLTPIINNPLPDTPSPPIPVASSTIAAYHLSTNTIMTLYNPKINHPHHLLQHHLSPLTHHLIPPYPHKLNSHPPFSLANVILNTTTHHSSTIPLYILFYLLLNQTLISNLLNTYIDVKVCIMSSIPYSPMALWSSF